MGMRSLRQNPDGDSSINPPSTIISSSSSATKRRFSCSTDSAPDQQQASSNSYSSSSVSTVPPSLPPSQRSQSQSQAYPSRHPRQQDPNTSLLTADRQSGPSIPHPVSDSYHHIQKRPKLTQSLSGAAPMKKLGNNSKPVGGAVLSSLLRPHTGAKKLVVKNLRSANPAREAAIKQYYEKQRLDVQDALDAILDGKVPSRPYDGLDKGVEDLCRSGNAQWIYDTIQKKMDQHLRAIFSERLEPVARNATTEDRAIALVRITLACWKDWSKQTATIRNVFSFLDRSYLLVSRTFQQLNDLAIALFKNIIFVSRPDKEPLVSSAVLDGMCILVQYERENHAMKDTKLLKDAVSVMNVLGLYTRLFEPTFLSRSRSYFANLSKDCAETHSLLQYVGFCTQYLLQEEERCMLFNFDSATKKQLLEDANRIFVAERKAKLLDADAISRLLEENQVGSMKNLFHLLRQSGLDKELQAPWQEYITATGSKIVSDANKADMVVRLLLLRRDLDVMVRDAFDRNDEFTKGLREAFDHFVNDKKLNSTRGTGTSKVGEMVAKYLDMLLRGGLKALPPALLSNAKGRQDVEPIGHASSGDSQDAELDRQLDNALELFRFIQGKDVFEAFYKKDLAKRLLMNRSASHDAERNMMAKFRGECGSSFTQNLEQMFKDRELAEEDMKAYKQYREAKGIKGGIDLHVCILSASSWPTYPEVPCKLPPEIHTQINQFDTYYRIKHKGRQLTWKHNLAQCQVRAQFNRGPKELLVSGFQAIILLLFNGQPEWTAEEIAKQTGIPTAELNLTLQSLSLGKARVLRKFPIGPKEVSPTDIFCVNANFWDPKYRVKINMIQMKETPQENKETHERVAADRMFETQAAIVRILKSRKQIGHNELVTEVINATKKRGAIDVAIIKQNIEKLIDKDYMERDPDTGEYLYMA